MCDRHAFQFDVDKAYEDQLVSALEASPEHPLSAPEISSQPGVYVLFNSGLAVYVGQAVKLRSRLRDHLKKVENRRGIRVDEVTCRFLTIEKMWEVARAEDALIRHYNPEWNGIPGFSMHVPGGGRPGMPGYVNEWDTRSPRRSRDEGRHRRGSCQGDALG
jgi:hypothetical protein